MDNSNEKSDIFQVFFFGVFFSITQFTYFFLLEVFLSSRAVPFFIALFFWLTGFLAGLNLKKPKLLWLLTGICIAAYYVALMLVRSFPFHYGMLPIVGGCIAVSGVLPGYFFFDSQKRFGKAKDLFLHENNGFILGIILSLLGMVFAGKWMLAWAPFGGSLPAILAAFWRKERHS